MTNTAYLFSVALLSAAAAFAQVPGGSANLLNEATDSSLAASNLSADSDSVSASSQSGNAAPKEPGKLHIFVVPGYLWMSGLSGNIGVKNVTLPINASFKDVFDNLNIGYMGGGDIRYGRLGLLTDVVYIKLTTQEQSTPFGVLYGTARTRAKTFFIEPDVYGRVVDTKAFSVDAFAGVRVWRLDNGLDLSAGRLPALSLDSTNVWADPLLGGRFRVNLKRGLFGEFKGDAGIGPNETWEILAGGGKEIKQKYNLLLAYRHLNAYQRDSGFLFDGSMSGVIIGFGIRFK
jgi:hypothetical protein